MFGSSSKMSPVQRIGRIVAFAIPTGLALAVFLPSLIVAYDMRQVSEGDRVNLLDRSGVHEVTAVHVDGITIRDVYQGYEEVFVPHEQIWTEIP